MKFEELPENIQEVAAALLSKKLDECLLWDMKDRTDKSTAIAETVREAFVKLYE